MSLKILWVAPYSSENYPLAAFKRVSEPPREVTTRVGLRICIFNNFPGDADTAGLKPTF